MGPTFSNTDCRCDVLLGSKLFFLYGYSCSPRLIVGARGGLEAFLSILSCRISDQAEKAVKCSVEMQKRLEELNQHWFSDEDYSLTMRI